MSVDTEKGGTDGEPIGFASLAGFIASDKEHSASVYRRFERLAARNILYLQAELRELEVQLEELDLEDSQGEFDAIESAMDWQLLCERAADQAGRKHKERKDVIMKVREKVKEYQETVLRNAQMLHLQRPTKQVRNAFRGHFYNRHKKAPFPRLSGVCADLYDHEFEEDLVALARSPDEDRLTTWVRNHFPTLFKRKSVSDSSVAYLSEYRLQMFVGIVNVVVAGGTFFGAIFNLYFVKNQQTRLGLIAGYTTTFAICIGLLTNARRSEIFGACAAYAAVLMVFVGGNPG